jgi:hypothetical protein
VTAGYVKRKERWIVIERQNLIANIKENGSLIFYCDMKYEWAREAHSLLYKK